MKSKTYKYNYYPYSGIYAIVNKITGKMYIGQSIHVYNRIRSHFTALSKGHDNLKLQRSVNKYGIENFYGKVIQIITNPYLLDDYEDFYIEYFNTRKCGYNIAKGGKSSGDTLSEHPNKEIIYQKQHYTKKIHNSYSKNTGPKTKESKNKVSQSLKEYYNNGGKPWNKGKKLTLETRVKLSESHKGYVMPEEQKKKISQSNKGKHSSPERNKKVSEGRKRFYQNGGKTSNTTFAYSGYSRRLSKLIRLGNTQLVEKAKEYVLEQEKKYNLKMLQSRIEEINKKHNIYELQNFYDSIDNILHNVFLIKPKIKNKNIFQKIKYMNKFAELLKKESK